MNFVTKNKLEKIYFAKITWEYGLLRKINYRKYICKNIVVKITSKINLKKYLKKVFFTQIQKNCVKQLMPKHNKKSYSQFYQFISIFQKGKKQTRKSTFVNVCNRNK